MNSTEKEYPKISIVTPSYNQGSYLEETILSVLNQKYPNLEYIIIDGGSTDSSVEIIKKYASYLSYWVSEKDSGQSEALNKGFNRASGEIIAWLNSDDLYCENTLHIIAEKFMEHPEVGIVYGDVINFMANGKETRITNQFDLFDFSPGYPFTSPEYSGANQCLRKQIPWMKGCIIAWITICG